MNPVLLNAIQQVEHKYGSVNNPNADLSNVHYIAKKLGLFGNRKECSKNRLWYINNEYITFNPKLMKTYHLLLNNLPVIHIAKILHISTTTIRQIRNIVKSHKKLELMDKSSILSIVG